MLHRNLEHPDIFWLFEVRSPIKDKNGRRNVYTVFFRDGHTFVFGDYLVKPITFVFKHLYHVCKTLPYRTQYARLGWMIGLEITWRKEQ